MATHALIPMDWRVNLGEVSANVGTPQSQLVSEAVGRLLIRAGTGFIPDTPPLARGSLVALIARIPAEQQKALHTLADRTRIRYSEWLRQAVVDVLREHGRMLETPPPAPAAPAAPTSTAAQVGDRCRCGLRLMPGESAPCEDCREAA